MKYQARVISFKLNAARDEIEDALATYYLEGWRVVGVMQPTPSVSGQWEYRVIVERPALPEGQAVSDVNPFYSIPKSLGEAIVLLEPTPPTFVGIDWGHRPGESYPFLAREGTVEKGPADQRVVIAQYSMVPTYNLEDLPLNLRSEITMRRVQAIVAARLNRMIERMLMGYAITPLPDEDESRDQRPVGFVKETCST